jgi:antitoxin component HigA of HigAB toxin-antitoxin module
MALMRELVGDDDWHYEVEEVTDAYLDKEWGGQDTPDEVCGTLRQWLTEATEPQWIAGTE